MYSAQELSCLTKTSDRTLREYASNALEKGRETITTKGQTFYVRKEANKYQFSETPFREVSTSTEVSLSGTNISDTNKKVLEKTVYLSQDIDLSIPTPLPVYFQDSHERSVYDALDDQERRIVDFKVRITIEYKAHKKKPSFDTVTAFLEHWNDYYQIELERCGMVLKREYLSRWERIFNTEGNFGFLKKTGRQKGTHSVPAWAVQFLKSTFWSNNGRIRNKNLYRILNKEAYNRGELSQTAYKRTMREKNIGGIISLTQIGKITRELRQTREYQYAINPDKFKNSVETGFGDAREKAEYVNHFWEIDSTKLDAFGKDENGESTWNIIAISDVKSAMKVVSIVKNSNAQGIAELLFKAFKKIGIPEHVVTDNGKDYLSNHIIDLFTRMGIKHVRTAPYAGEQKPFAERHFGTIQNAFTELLNNFKGHSVSEMQAINALTSTPDRLSGKTPNKETEHIQEIAIKLDEWVDHIYAQSFNTGLGCSPYESYIEDEYRINRGNMQQLAYSFGKRVLRTVSKGDGISINNIKYNNVQGLLGGHVGIEVDIAMDMLNSNICYVFEKTGEYICIATTDKITEEGIKASKVFAREIKKRAKKLINDGKKAMEGIDHVQDLIDVSKEVFGNLTPIQEVGGTGFTQNSGNIKSAEEIGEQIDQDLKAEIVRNETPDIEKFIAYEKEQEAKSPKKKILTYEDIVNQELAVGE